MLHGDLVLVNRWAKVVNEFKLGDVVTFWWASTTSLTAAAANSMQGSGHERTDTGDQADCSDGRRYCQDSSTVEGQDRPYTSRACLGGGRRCTFERFEPLRPAAFGLDRWQDRRHHVSS